MKFVPKKQGFTLLELLVSVAIIGILSAISVASYQEYKVKAYDAHANVMVHNLHTAVQVAISDFGGNDIGNYSAQAYPNGSISGSSTFDVVAPGITVDDEMFISVMIWMSCLNGASPFPACTEYAVAAGHCKGTYVDLGGNYILSETVHNTGTFVRTWDPWWAVFGCD